MLCLVLLSKQTLQKNEKQITSILIGSLSALSLLFISNGLVEDNKMTTLAAVLIAAWLTMNHRETAPSQAVLF